MILLDTHALVWWANGDHQRLSTAALETIEGERRDGRILISSISAWELAMLVSRGRLELTMDIAEWLSTVGSIDSVEFVPVDNDIALKSVQLPGTFHKDPADRMIVATAHRFGVPIVTADEKILDYPHIRTVW